MPAPRNRKHILVPGSPEAVPYTPPQRGYTKTKPAPPTSRTQHGKALEQALQTAVIEAQKRRSEAGIVVHGAKPGIYVRFDSQPGVPLQVTSLEDAGLGIEVVAVSETTSEDAQPRRVEHATVFVPDGKVKHFLERFRTYAKTTPKSAVSLPCTP